MTQQLASSTLSSDLSSDNEQPVLQPPDRQSYIREEETLILEDPRKEEILINRGHFYRRPSQQKNLKKPYPLQHNLNIENISEIPLTQEQAKTKNLFEEITSPIPYENVTVFQEEDQQPQTRDSNCEGFNLEKENIEYLPDKTYAPTAVGTHSQNYSITTTSNLMGTVRSPTNKPPRCPSHYERRAPPRPQQSLEIETNERKDQREEGASRDERPSFNPEASLVTWRHNSGAQSPQALDLKHLTMPSNADLYRTESIEKQHFNTLQSTGPNRENEEEIVMESSLSEPSQEKRVNTQQSSCRSMNQEQTENLTHEGSMSRPDCFSYKSFNSQVYNVPNNSVFNSSQQCQFSLMSVGHIPTGSKLSIGETEAREMFDASQASYLESQQNGRQKQIATPVLLKYSQKEKLEELREEFKKQKIGETEPARLNQDPEIPRKLKNMLRRQKTQGKHNSQEAQPLQETAKFKQRDSRHFNAKIYLEDQHQCDDKSNLFLKELLASQICSRRGSSLQVNYPEEDDFKTSKGSVYVPFSARKGKEPSILGQLGREELSTQRAESSGKHKQARKDSMYERLTREIKESVLNELNQLRSDFNQKLDVLNAQKEEKEKQVEIEEGTYGTQQTEDECNLNQSLELRRDTTPTRVTPATEMQRGSRFQYREQESTPYHFGQPHSVPYHTQAQPSYMPTESDQVPIYPRNFNSNLRGSQQEFGGGFSEADIRSFSIGTEQKARTNGTSQFAEGSRRKSSPLNYPQLYCRKTGRCVTPSSIAQYYNESIPPSTSTAVNSNQQISALVEENRRLKLMYENQLRKKAKRRAKKLQKMKQRLVQQERIIQEEIQQRETRQDSKRTQRLSSKNADTQTSARYGGLSLNLTQSSYLNEVEFTTNRFKSPLLTSRYQGTRGDPVRVEQECQAVSPFQKEEITVREVIKEEAMNIPVKEETTQNQNDISSSSMSSSIPPGTEIKAMQGVSRSLSPATTHETEQLVSPFDPHFYDLLKTLFCEISMEKNGEGPLHRETMHLFIRELFKRCGYTRILPLYKESINILLRYRDIRECLGHKKTIDYLAIVNMVQTVQFLRFVAPYISAVTGQEFEVPVKEVKPVKRDTSSQRVSEHHSPFTRQSSWERKDVPVKDNMVRVTRNSTPVQERVRDQVLADKANLRAAVDKFREKMVLQSSIEETNPVESVPTSIKSNLEMELEQAYQKSMSRVQKSTDSLKYYSKFTKSMVTPPSNKDMPVSPRTSHPTPTIELNQINIARVGPTTSRSHSSAYITAKQSTSELPLKRTNQVETEEQKMHNISKNSQTTPNKSPNVSKGDFLFQPSQTNHSFVSNERSAVKVPELQLSSLKHTTQLAPTIVVIRPDQLSNFNLPQPVQRYIPIIEGANYGAPPQIVIQSPYATAPVSRPGEEPSNFGNTSSSGVPHVHQAPLSSQSFVNDSLVMDTLSTISMTPSARDIMKHARTPPRPVLSQEMHLTLLQLLSPNAIEFNILNRLFMGDTMMSAGISKWSLTKAIKTYTYYMHRKLDKRAEKRDKLKESARSYNPENISLNQSARGSQDNKFLVLLHIGREIDLQALAKHNKGFEGVYGNLKAPDPTKVISKLQFLNDIRSFASYLTELENQGLRKVEVLASVVLAQNSAIETNYSLQHCLQNSSLLQSYSKLGVDGVMFQNEGVYLSLNPQNCVPAYFLEFQYN